MTILSRPNGASPWLRGSQDALSTRKLSRTPWTSSRSTAHGQPSRTDHGDTYFKYDSNKRISYYVPNKTNLSVCEMLECAKELGNRPEASHISFQDVCNFVSERKKTPSQNKPTSQPRPLDKDGVALQRKTRNMTKCYGDCEVFLGGSCNPTTWRKDVAIPTLNNKGISYYNPQVPDWRPELIDQEHNAKEKASLLFFVLDNQTRGVSALIEVAQIAGQRKKLILVIQSYTQKNQSICGEQITLDEYEDVREGQSIVKWLVKRQDIPVFEKIDIALECTVTELRKDNSNERNHLKTHKSRISESVLQNKFNNLDSEKRGKIRLEDAWTGAYDLVNDKSLSPFSGDGTEEVNYEEFCDMVRGEEMRSKGPESYDVVVCGSDKDASWRDATAIPLLQQEGIRWCAPRRWSSDIDVNFKTMEASSVLLFVITNTCRGIATMAMAGFFIGRKKNVVLCVQQLPANAKIGNEELTCLAIKDYNRGRMYLTDLAHRAKVPVFSNIADAVKCAANMSRGLPSP